MRLLFLCPPSLHVLHRVGEEEGDHVAAERREEVMAPIVEPELHPLEGGGKCVGITPSYFWNRFLAQLEKPRILLMCRPRRRRSTYPFLRSTGRRLPYRRTDL